MCRICNDRASGHALLLARRGFLTLAAGAALGLATFRPGFSAPAAAPPKPENVISPDAALERLMKGNARYVDGVSRLHDFKHEREVLTKGQNPFAGILGCADSRIAPEYAFDAGRGDLFVCRVAGNIANTDAIASLEYAVQVLSTPLLMVLGLRRGRGDHPVGQGWHHASGASAVPGRRHSPGRPGGTRSARQCARQRDQRERHSQCRQGEGGRTDHQQAGRREESARRRSGVQPCRRTDRTSGLTISGRAAERTRTGFTPLPAASAGCAWP
jgi:hypothetical protein